MARIDHGEDLLKELNGLAVREDIRSAFFMILGAAGGLRWGASGKKRKHSWCLRFS